MAVKPKVALAQDFLSTLAKLPSSVQNKVLKWAITFQTDPTSNGINYEKIKAARDDNLRSVRIDQDWRGIVFRPPQGDVYVLLYVAHHDEAYHWAEQRRMSVNPITGAMQVLVTEQVLDAAAPAATESQPHIAVPEVAAKTDGMGVTTRVPLFAGPADEELVSLGVPEPYLARVRSITAEIELDALQPLLPVEAYEGLFLLAAGDTVTQILVSRETRVDRKVDTADFAAALVTAESRARFVVVDTNEEMQAILNAPLAQWRVFLHPTQRKLASADMNGPARVLGGAGTGKTVLAMHRAKWLAEHATKDGQKVLFTTFTRNLALDVKANLAVLCSPAVLEQIECVNLDAWVYGFLHRRKYEYTIVYGRGDKARDVWERALSVRDNALDLSDEFYAEELEQVVLAQGITTLDEYRLARRAGRGQVLTRKKRDVIWPVFAEYRDLLALRKLREVDDAYRDAAVLLESQKDRTEYSAIIVDETQDFGPQALRLLRAMIPHGRNDLFFVGDGHQRIYKRNKAALSRSGIDIRGRARKLYLNYRTTEEIRRAAVALLEGCEIDDLDEGTDESKRYRSLTKGAVPMVVDATGVEQAVQTVVDWVRAWRAEAEPNDAATTAVVARSGQTRDLLAAAIQRAGFRTEVVDGFHADSTDVGVVYLATMHRAKGLEFDQVVVLAPAIAKGPAAETGDERRLIYVAITRAKRRAGLVWVP